MKPLAIDLFCGLGGWTDGLLAEGYHVVGFDIERHEYGEERYPAQMVIQDVLTLHGSQFKGASLIVASPPCQEFSYMAMPWSLAKAKQSAIEADTTGAAHRKLTALFDACFRIQREAIEAAGHHIPMVVENVRGAGKWVGRSRWNYGSFHLWGDVPALMPPAVKAVKQNRKVIQKDGHNVILPQVVYCEGAKNDGGSWFNIGGPGQKVTNQNPVHALAGEGVKQRGSGREWFAGEGKISRLTSSKSPARKFASAMIAKIPEPLSRHIAATFFPHGRDNKP